MNMDRCKVVLERVRGHVAKYKGMGLTEQDTKNALIEPMLASFGWPKDDLERVRAEYRHTSKSNPVDYALLSRGRPVLLVEAKALDVSADEYKFVAQVITYANMAGAEWALVTNGDQWDLYAVLAKGDVGKKLIFSAKVGDADFLDWMAWISPSRVEASELDRFWRLLVAERRVKATVETMFRERSDALVKLLAHQTGLHEGEVATALQTLHISFAGPSMEGRIQILAGVSDPAPKAKPPKPPKKASKAKPKPKPPTGGNLSQLQTPLPYKKPGVLNIGNRSWELNSWRDLLRYAIEDLYQRAPGTYAGIFDAPELQGKKRAYFSHEHDGMLQPVEIPDGYAEGNLSASAVVRVVNKLWAWAGVNAEVNYTYKA
jgi:predicted type IV restriction endonuclease